MANPKEKKGRKEPPKPPENGSIRQAIEKLRQDPAVKLPPPYDPFSQQGEKPKEPLPDAVVKFFSAVHGPFKERNRLRKVFGPVPVSVPFLKGDAGLSTRGELLSAYERPAGKAKLQNHWVVYEEINGSFYSLRGKIPGKLIDVTHPDGKPGKAVVAVRNPATEKEEIVRDKDGNPCVLFYVDEALKPIIWFPPRDQDEPKG